MRLNLLTTCLLALLVSPIASGEETATRGGHTLGDCLLPDPGNTTTCRQYLVLKGNIDGIDYLDETPCPTCEMGPQIGVNVHGLPEHEFFCLGGNFSNPQNFNLDVTNQHFRKTDGGEEGATLVAFGERVCWEGGNCTEGLCEMISTQAVDPNTNMIAGVPVCQKSGFRILHIVKIFGDVCIGPVNEEEAMESDMDGDSESDMPLE